MTRRGLSLTQHLILVTLVSLAAILVVGLCGKEMKDALHRIIAALAGKNSQSTQPAESALAAFDGGASSTSPGDSRSSSEYSAVASDMPAKSPARAGESFSPAAAADYATENALKDGGIWCARYVANAIDQTGGGPLERAKLAKDFGPGLEKASFVQVSHKGDSDFKPQKGDVVVIKPPVGGIRRKDGKPDLDANGKPIYYTEADAGHMAIFNGENWVSDFVQDNSREGSLGGLYPGPAFREMKPEFTIYRYSDSPPPK